MSHVSDPYVIIGIMHDSIRVQMVSISRPWSSPAMYRADCRAASVFLSISLI